MKGRDIPLRRGGLWGAVFRGLWHPFADVHPGDTWLRWVHVFSAPFRIVLFGTARALSAPSRTILKHTPAAVASALHSSALLQTSYVGGILRPGFGRYSLHFGRCPGSRPATIIRPGSSVMQLLPVLLLAALFFTSCGNGFSRTGVSGSGGVTESGQTAASSAVQAPKLDIPQPPAMLTDDSLRLEWLAEHYWDNFDLSDTRWIADTATLEGTFTPWAQILSRLPLSQAVPLAGGLISSGDSFPDMQLRLLEVAEYFWHHPNSPFRSEELFISVLEAVVETPGIDSLYKIRPRSQLTSALKNRPGMRAADLTYTLGSGATGRLSDIRAEYTLLMFYNPGCQECARVEDYIVRSETFSALISSGRMKVLAIYPDEDITAWTEHLPLMPTGWTVGHAPMKKGGTAAYDLPGIPALYLLDRNKKVIIKDRPVETVEAWFEENTKTQL